MTTAITTLEQYAKAEAVLFGSMKHLVGEIALCGSGGGSGRASSYAATLVTVSSALSIVQELRVLDHANLVPEQHEPLREPEPAVEELPFVEDLEFQGSEPVEEVPERPKRGAPVIDKNGEGVAERLARARAARSLKAAEEKQKLRDERLASRRVAGSTPSSNHE